MEVKLEFNWELVERNIETGKEKIYVDGSSEETAKAALELRKLVNDARGVSDKYELFIRQRKEDK